VRLDDDEKLIDRFLAGDVTGFDELVRRYQKMVYGLAYQFVRNHSDADEVAQKTFLAVYRKLSSFNRQSAFKTWIYRISVNLAKNQIRDRNRHSGEEVSPRLADIKPSAEEVLRDSERDKLVSQAIRLLPEKQRQVVLLRVANELPYKEIAQILDCSESAAKVHFHYALQTLKRRLST